MKRRFFVIVFLIIITIACALWAPWQRWDLSIASLVGVEDTEKFARLQVSSLAGEIEITIDNEKRGTVGPEGSPFAIEDIKPGKRLLKLSRVSDKPNAYITFERLIEFNADLDTVIAYELGPSQEFSEGHLISAFKNYANAEETRLNISTNPNDVQVLLDEQLIGNTPLKSLSLDTSKKHTLTLRKRGYEDLIISLLPEEQEQRSKLAGFEIDVEANLFLLPIKVEH